MKQKIALIGLLVTAGSSLMLAGCTTTSTTAQSRAVGPRILSGVDQDKGRACINAAANRYFLPDYVITARSQQAASNGATIVNLDVDIRTAQCTISRNGRSVTVVDTSPKSADQVAAEKAAAAGRSI